MLKKLLNCLGKYKKISILAIVFVGIECFFDVFIPLMMSYVIDKGITPKDSNALIFYGVILIGICFIAMIFGVIGSTLCAKATAGFSKNLRKKIFYNVQTFSFSNIDKFSTSSIVTRHTTDIANVEKAFQMIIKLAVRSPLMLIFSLIMAFVINKKLAMIFLIAIPFLGFGLYYIATHAHPIFERGIKVYDSLNNSVEENIRGIRVVKSYVTEEKEINKFNNISQKIYNEFSKGGKLVALNEPLMNFTVSLIIVLIVWFGSHEIAYGKLTTGELTSLISYAMSILISLMILSNVLVTILISRASAERIVELLDEKTTLTNKENPIMNVKDGSIDFNDVNFSYINDAKKLCLKNINIHINSGETIGIIGGTGSSKSSFVQLIPRIYDVTSGSLKVGGIDVRDYDLVTLRDEVAMVLQKNVLFSGTIKENLRWGKEDANDEEIIKACKLAQADEFIETFPNKYDTYIEQGGNNVSGGQKQRLCIARALLKKPKILILDDSTSAVDTKTDSLIRKAFKEEIPSTTKIIIAQRISSVEDADRIIVLDNGLINGIGTHEELLKNNSIYKEVYNSQMKGGNE